MIKALLPGRKAIAVFFFEPASAKPLAVLRVGLSALLLWQAFVMRESYLDFFAPMGFVQKEVSRLLESPWVPKLNGLLDLSSALALSANQVLTGFGLLYILGLLCLMAGFFTRGSAFFVWLLHWSLANTGYSGAYGADMYAHIFLFYLMVVPCGEAYSLDVLLGRASGAPSLEARLGLRVLQLHMCLSYFASGLEKASGSQWWNGEVMWQALNTPGYSPVDFHWLAQVPWLPMVVGWIVLAIEGLYGIMVWPKQTRKLWVLATCALHIGIAIFLRLPIFGILMCIPSLALFAIGRSVALKAP